MGMMPPSVGQAPTAPTSFYDYPAYLFKRRFFQFLGARVDIFAPSGKQVLVCHQKAFKLKEDIRLYADESKQRELLTIKARNIIDFSAAYDVVDAVTGQKVGVLRRKGWSSMIRDAWEVMNDREQLVARIQEDNLALALVRRFIELASLFLPQAFHFSSVSGVELAKAKQQFNPFIMKIDLQMPRGANADIIDPRLVLAATTLLVLIEGRQR